MINPSYVSSLANSLERLQRGGQKTQAITGNNRNSAEVYEWTSQERQRPWWYSIPKGFKGVAYLFVQWNKMNVYRGQSNSVISSTRCVRNVPAKNLPSNPYFFSECDFIW